MAFSAENDKAERERQNAKRTGKRRRVKKDLVERQL